MARKKAAAGGNGKSEAAEKSKSDAIRDYDRDHPGESPKAAQEGLLALGYDVSRQFISNIRSNDKRKGGRKPGRPGRKAGRGPGRPPMTEQVRISDLVEAKRLADQLGGVGEAQRLLDALAKLGG